MIKTDTLQRAIGRVERGFHDEFAIRTLDGLHYALVTVREDVHNPQRRRRFIRELRQRLRAFPRDLTVVVIDLTALDEITVEVAVLVNLERRLLSLHDLKLVAVRRRHEPVGPVANEILRGVSMMTGDLSVAIAEVAHQELTALRLAS